MRTITSGDITLTYPDYWAFCFSPQYVAVTGATAYSVVQFVLYNGYGTYRINCALYNGEARAYVSRYLQLLAYDPMAGTRINDCVLQVKAGASVNSLTEIFSTSDTDTIQIVWGALEPVKRISSVGAYAYNADEVAFVRRVRWFKNFPFKVSVFGTSSQTYQTRYDGNGYGSAVGFGANGYKDFVPANIFSAATRFAVIKVLAGTDPASTFDDTFDYTFQNLAAADVITRLIVDNSTEGYYLRWIDTWGQLQYFLFAKGTRTLKITEGATIESDILYSGVYYGGGRLAVEKTREKSVKVAAMNLTPEECDYVETIASACVCHLYLGKQTDNTEIWIPVRVSGGTFTTSERKDLQDFEIEVQIPTAKAQTL